MIWYQAAQFDGDSRWFVVDLDKGSDRDAVIDAGPWEDEGEARTFAGNLNKAMALSWKRGDVYADHFDGCTDCPGTESGECARAVELRLAWQEAERATRIPVTR
jgi:hypothetical protein